MRTPNARSSPLDRLRASIGDLRRWFFRQPNPMRWGVGLAMLAALVAAGYHYAASEPIGSEWLFDGKTFSRAEAAKIVAVLREANIPSVESGGKIGVASDRKSEAIEVLTKNKVGPRLIDDIRDEVTGIGSLWISARDRELIELRVQEKTLREAIARLPGVTSPTVVLTPVPSGTRFRPTLSYTAMVFVQSESGQPLPAETVAKIRHVLKTLAPTVEPNGVTLLDLTNGHEYLVAGQPDLEAESTVRVREEEIREKILNQVNFIEGVRVAVSLDESPAEPRSVPTPPAETAPEAPKANQPIGELPPLSEVPPTPTPGPRGTGKATVLVRVPRSYYLRLYRESHPGHEPSADDLRPYVVRIEESIRTAVEYVVPKGSLAQLKVDRIDDLSPARPPAPPTEPETTRALPAWLPAAALTALVLAVLWGGWMASRRPAIRPTRPVPREPFEVADTAGPSERVQKLVRLDPAAAAGVLHRWISHGGRTA